MSQELLNTVKELWPTLTMSSKQIPSLNADPDWEHFRWDCTLSLAGKALTVPYLCGIACVSETLKSHGYCNGRHTMDSRDVLNDLLSMARSLVRVSPPPPQLLDVLSCLVLDSDCLNCSTFEEWAETLGFNPDSRKDEQTYNACVSQSLRLLQLFGAQGLEKLRELFQNY